MTPRAIAHAVASHHAAMLAGEAVAYAHAVLATDDTLSPQMAGVLQGCRMLGFLEHDTPVSYTHLTLPTNREV